MTTLVPIVIDSIYFKSNKRQPLPSRMAWATTDTKLSLEKIASDVKSLGANLYLSDLFRSYDMQYQAHQDYVTGKKKAYSPPPGGSFHEAGRAFDLDLAALKPLGTNYLERFWEISSKYGVTPIISKPDPSISESWHFECLGRYKSIKSVSYSDAARSAIMDIGVRVDGVKDQLVAWVQSELFIRGFYTGAIDGDKGPKTNEAIKTVKGISKWLGSSQTATEADLIAIDPWLIRYLEAPVL